MIPNRREWLVGLAVIFLVVLALFLTANKTGDFWWFDASQHALNGLFYRDLVVDMPIHNLKQWAFDYYIKYPSLTVVFYPPLFHLFEAAVFLIFGFSNFTAQATVMLFYYAFGAGCWLLARRWVEPWIALACAVFTMAAPGAALWGRQVMLEIPSLAFAVWSIWLLLRYADTLHPRWLWFAVAALVAGINTKQTVAFLAAVFVIVLWRMKDARWWRDWRVWGAFVFGIAGLIPLGYLTFKFAPLNFVLTLDTAKGEYARWSLGNWTFYSQAQLELCGLLLLPLLGWLAVSALRRDTRVPREALFVLGGWFAAGYFFFSLVVRKEPRYGLSLILPLCFGAAFAFAHLRPRLAGPTAAMASLLALSVTLLAHPAPYVRGYREAADQVMKYAPKDAVVLVFVHRDANFIYRLREAGTRPDISILRADKLLLSYTGNRSAGIEAPQVTEKQLLEMIEKFGVSYVVLQPGFWDDLQPIKCLGQVLAGATFQRVASIPVSSNVTHTERVLEVYRNRLPVKPNMSEVHIKIPMAGIQIDKVAQ